MNELYKLFDIHVKETSEEVTLLQILKEHINRYKERNHSISLSDLFHQYWEMQKQKQKHVARITLDQIRYTRHRFEGTPLAGKMVSDIHPRQLEEVLSELKGGTRNRYVKLLRSMWTYAIRKGYAKENVAVKLDSVVLPDKPIQIFPNEVIRGMLDLALTEEIELVPFLALGAFAGLRVDSKEMTHILWSDIKFEEKTIIVRAEISKTGDRRFIPIHPNLEAWLKVYLERQPMDGRVLKLLPGTLKKARRRIFGKVSPRGKWIPAGLRHSYASAMINSGESQTDTVLALGHKGNRTMLYNHYLYREPREQALLYWEIFPPVRTS
jgi:integrase